MSVKERLRTSSSGDSLAPLEASIPEQQMLTPQEILDRRKARRMLEHKRVALEEAVERRVCEKIYTRIWRHRSTLDEARDEKLRSRTAALALVGIGLQDLGVKFDKAASNDDLVTPDQETDEYIAKARQELLAMNNVQHPLGKLQHLAAAHKVIVDLLTTFHQSSSSADEILPTLIYTLITSPSSGMNVISNLYFAQRFRNTSKIDGEAAYCLTNLEAAISFLETVDLASLRSDEPLEGPPKSSSRPTTPSASTPTEVIFSPVTTPPSAKPLPEPPIPVMDPLSSPMPSSPTPKPATPLRSPAHTRRVSDIFNPSTSALSTASNTVRNTADQGLKNITTTLDHSFNFLFGRLREQQVTSPIAVPRTLDDARKLVEPKSAEDEEAVISGASSLAEQQLDGPVEQANKPDDKLLGFFAGRPPPRDRSVDSTLSSGSGKRVAFAPSSAPIGISAGKDRLSESPQAAVNSPIDSMRSFGNSINPLKGFSGMSVMRGFGRSASTGKETPTLTTLNASTKATPKEHESAVEVKATPLTNGHGLPVNTERGDLSGPSAFSTQGDKSRSIQEPVQRFMEMANASDMKLSEVDELLSDYKRLASSLKELDMFKL